MAGLEGRRAIITGASAGLGAAVAGELAVRGARLILCSRAEGRLRRAAAAIAARPFLLAADVLDPETAPRLAAMARENLGGLDILVCNAGGPPPGDFGELDDAQWEAAFRLILLSPIRLIRACLPLLAESGSGRIILMNSISAIRPVKRLLLSNAIRPGLVGLARHLAGELADRKILVNVIAPGFFATDRSREVHEAIALQSGRTLSEVQNEANARIALKRHGDPAELGRLIAFLVSMENTYITGQTIVIDGGLTVAP
ncbi:MAG: SDR family oxidoreductase [Candidatus Eisenbacteria bacterium]